MKKILFSIFFILVLVFCFAFQVNADPLTPYIYVSKLTFVLDRNQIIGQFDVLNSENFYATDLSYAIELFKGTNVDSMQLIDVFVPQENISLGPHEDITKSFSYQYPKNIVSGDYTLRAHILTAKGMDLGWQDQDVSLKGDGKFLDIKNSLSRVLVGTNSYLPMEGGGVSLTDKVIVHLKVENPGDAITVIPNIKIFDRQYNMALAKQYQDSPITFKKNETKDIDLIMPKFETPESYLTEVKFYSNNEQVSGVQYFRWVLAGDGGKIFNITTDKDSYAIFENMKITVAYIGPADLSSIDGAKLQVTVYDQNKNIIYDKYQTVNLNMSLGSSVVTIPMTKDLFNPTIDAKILKGDKLLDEYKITLPIYSKEAKQLQERSKFVGILFYPVIIVILIIVLLVVTLLFLKFKSKH